MSGGSLQLREYPAETVRPIVPKMRACRSIQKTKSVARYGGDIRLPDLREKISQCERHGQCMTPAWFDMLI